METSESSSGASSVGSTPHVVAHDVLRELRGASVVLTRLLGWAAPEPDAQRRATVEPSGDRPLGAQLATSDRPRSIERKLLFLRTLLERDQPLLEPSLDASERLGHRWELAEECLALEPAAAHELLETLADSGMLKRELSNRVHLCNECGWCQLNMRETCPSCRSIDLRTEWLLHHFRCALVGLESEFQQGLELICPGCKKQLHQLGQDFDRPHVTYVCNGCDWLIEEPALEAQCLQCEARFPGSDLVQHNIYSYRATDLAARAVELGRLTGVDLSTLLRDSRTRMDSFDFLKIEIQREVQRLERLGGSLSVASLCLVSDGAPYPIFRAWNHDAFEPLARILRGTRAPLDLFARLDEARIGILLPSTDASGAARVRQRVLAELQGLVLQSTAGERLVPRWEHATWEGGAGVMEQVLEFLGFAGEGG